jgi:hypothetical protein
VATAGARIFKPEAMSHKLKTPRTRVQTEDNPTLQGGVIIEAYTLGKIDSERVSERSLTCQSPVCKDQFEQTGVMRLEPRKYCRDQCRLDAWHLREAARLLENETDQRVIEILRGKP